MKKTVLSTALSAALLVALGFSMSACSSDKEGESHEVKAVDRVEEAAKLARANGPEAEDMDFPKLHRCQLRIWQRMVRQLMALPLLKPALILLWQRPLPPILL